MSKWQIRETQPGEVGQVGGGRAIAWGMGRETAEDGLEAIESIWRRIGEQREDAAARRFDTGTSIYFVLDRDEHEEVEQ